jgi:hypothetical protein
VGGDGPQVLAESRRYEQRANDAAYIAAMHPEVGKALAAWLREAVERHPEREPENWGLISWKHCGNCRAVRQMADGAPALAPAKWPCADAQRALNLARLIVGSTDG